MRHIVGCSDGVVFAKPEEQERRRRRGRTSLGSSLSRRFHRREWQLHPISILLMVNVCYSLVWVVAIHLRGCYCSLPPIE